MNLLFGFSGRIGRAQWWLGQLAIVGVLFVAALLVFMATSPAELEQKNFPTGVFMIIGVAIVLAMWINIATTVKRFHDRGKSGVWFLIVLVPYIGGLWQIVECGCLAGSPGTNDYGVPPGSSSFEDLEYEARAAYAEPVSRMATSMQSAPVATQPRAAAVQTRRSVPTGFGRRGSN